MFDEKGATHDRLLAFRVGTGHYTIALEWVCAVREAADPEGAVGIDKLTSCRDHEIPVFDPRQWGWGGTVVGVAGEPAGTQIIIGRGEEQVALLADATEGLVEAPEIRGFPAWIAPLAGEEFRGVALQPDGVLLVVDPEALLKMTRGDGATREAGGA